MLSKINDTFEAITYIKYGQFVSQTLISKGLTKQIK